MPKQKPDMRVVGWGDAADFDVIKPGHAPPAGTHRLSGLFRTRPCEAIVEKSSKQSAHEISPDWQRQLRKAAEQLAAGIAERLDFLPIVQRVEQRVEELSGTTADLSRRVGILESRNAIQQDAPLSFNPNPQLNWISENRGHLMEKYPGQWIAVSDAGLLGHDESLKALHTKMVASGHGNATFIKVGRPIPADSTSDA